MRLSKLQKYILRRAYENVNHKVNKKSVLEFYLTGRVSNKKDQETIVGRSLEGLIKEGYLRAYGYKTAKKWSINYVNLTRTGLKAAKKAFSFQPELPLK